MSTDDPLKNWQLEDRKQDAEQWKLEDAEQDLNKHLQLQPGEPGAQWQPIEYERNAQPRRRNWVLPSVLIVALLAVMGYVGWIAFGQMSGGEGLSIAGFIPGMEAEATATPTAEEEEAVVIATPEVPPTPEPVTPTSTPEPTATATLEPPPTIAMAQLISGTVNAVGGVNARKDPDITGEVLTLLDEGAAVIVVRQEGDWLQVILPDGVTVAWVAAEFVNQTTQPIPLADLATIYAGVGLPVPTAEVEPGLSLLPVAGVTTTIGITDVFATDPITTPVTTDAPPLLVTSGVIPAEPFTNTLPLIGPALTVTDTTGVNARSAPSTDGALIVVVPNGAVLPVTGRTLAGDWLQVRLPDGATAWMFADAVVASLDAASAPVAEAAATVTQTTTTPAASTPIEGVPSGVTATVTNELGANLRSAPSRDLEVTYSAALNESFAVVGRSGDGEWVQVVLPDGAFAWVLIATVQLSADAATLPVTQP